MGDYDKPMTPEDRAAFARLCIYHPDLLNPKYVETAEPEEEPEEENGWEGFMEDLAFSMAREA